MVHIRNIVFLITTLIYYTKRRTVLTKEVLLIRVPMLLPSTDRITFYCQLQSSLGQPKFHMIALQNADNIKKDKYKQKLPTLNGNKEEDLQLWKLKLKAFLRSKELKMLCPAMMLNRLSRKV